MIILPDGKILVAGYAEKQTEFRSRDFALALYDSDGSLDTSFGNQGKVITDFFGFSDGIADIVILSDGKILVAGSAQKESDLNSDDFSLPLYIVISNKNETLSDTIITNNVIKSTIRRSIHSSSL